MGSARPESVAVKRDPRPFALVAAERAIPTRHGSVTLEQLAEMQPGMARLMVEYAQRFWTMYYAAKAGNWPLAGYMHSEMMKLGKVVPVVRPIPRPIRQAVHSIPPAAGTAAAPGHGS